MFLTCIYLPERKIDVEWTSASRPARIGAAHDCVEDRMASSRSQSRIAESTRHSTSSEPPTPSTEDFVLITVRSLTPLNNFAEVISRSEIDGVLM